MCRLKTVVYVGVLVFHLGALRLFGQTAPLSPQKAWAVPRDARFEAEVVRIGSGSPPATSLMAEHVYTLPELVDLAESNNPETRILWEQAKQRASSLGIARAALFPTVAAVASASFSQYSLFMGRFYHEDLATFPAALNLSYTLFDFGSRGAKIDRAKAGLLAADFAFNDVHRRIAFQVTAAYYRLLDAMSQEEAARAALTDTEAVRQSVESRLANGLATLPDVLEARSAAAQAQYELASVQGLEEISRGALAALLGVSAASVFQVEDISKAPEAAREPVQDVIERALAQRPDLLAEIAQVRSADAESQQARAAYYPVLSVSSDWGHRNSYGSQNFSPYVTSHIYPYSVQLNLNWTIFDGGARRNEVSRIDAVRKEAEARAVLSRERIEEEIWTSYSELKTAQARQEAADALLRAAGESYQAATEAFQAGVRTFIDVTTAQRELARARAAQAAARIELLSRLADLAFRAGDPIRAAGH